VSPFLAYGSLGARNRVGRRLSITHTTVHTALLRHIHASQCEPFDCLIGSIILVKRCPTSFTPSLAFSLRKCPDCCPRRPLPRNVEKESTEKNSNAQIDLLERLILFPRSNHWHAIVPNSARLGLKRCLGVSGKSLANEKIFCPFCPTSVPIL
jgi:hypothetical protein